MTLFFPACSCYDTDVDQGGIAVEKVTPVNKMSKKARKAFHAKKRGTWHGISPVTRIASSGKGYDRAKEKQKALRSEETDR